MSAATLLCVAISSLLLRDVVAEHRETSQDQCPAKLQSCPEIKPGFINVHLIPHTHNDLGWLKTVDQYYYGSRNDIQRAGVQYILDAVVQELTKDHNKRFVWVETAFLWQWWEEQEEPLREQVRQLVNSGQLEIAGGGWSMNDEAVTHYQSTIDQFTWGFRKLDEMLGVCGRPHYGWQLDTFGHSSETASMMARFGFDALFFARLDSSDKSRRLVKQEMEFVWESSPNLGRSSWLFTHVLYDHYSAPQGQCYDIFCDDDPFIDNPRSPEYNVEGKVNSFLHYVSSQNSSYKTNNVMELMGNDFNYQVSGAWFKNMDKLIRYVNARQERDSRVNVFYSTPSCYLKAVTEAHVTDWPSNEHDFLPYANNGIDFWTGYYTSRPTLKYFERLANSWLQSVKRVSTLTSVADADSALTPLREILGVLQHHDAITGTEKQHVANDYAFRLHRGMAEAQGTLETALNKLMTKSADAAPVVMETCLFLNVSECPASENSDNFVVTIVNPLASETSRYVRVPVSKLHYRVTDHTGAELEVQLVPVPTHVRSVPGRRSDATHELVFLAVDLPALGFRSYHVTYVEEEVRAHLSTAESKSYIGNQRLQVHLDASSGRLCNVTLDGAPYTLQQDFMYYESSRVPYEKSSGAYMFKPQEGGQPIKFDEPVNFTVFSGPLVEEIHQDFSAWVHQVIRVYRDEGHFELEWQVGPIPDQGEGKEVISRFSTGWETEGTFFTDANGREMMERHRDSRPTWNFYNTEPVSGNYYPITSAISIKTTQSELVVVTDRAQGGSSISDGDLELMLHRRVFRDDEFGVDEPLNEIAFDQGLVARGRHVVLLGSTLQTPSVRAQQRSLTLSHSVLSPWLVFTSTDLTAQQWRQDYRTQYSGLTSALPDNVHLLTLEPWSRGRVLLRLEHFLEVTDDPQLSKPASVHLKDMFAELEVLEVSETYLGGNQALQHSQPPSENNDFEVQLSPMQIRTFVLQVRHK